MQYAPCPQVREAEDGSPIDPLRADFSGFVFKIQANMNPRHRDRVAFVRVCSGVLTKDMQVVNTRLQQNVRLSRPSRFFGRDRETIEEAYPGDVVGLVNPGRFGIGDTLYAGRTRRSIRPSRISRPSTSARCGCRTSGSSSSTMACGSWRRKA